MKDLKNFRERASFRSPINQVAWQMLVPCSDDFRVYTIYTISLFTLKDTQTRLWLKKFAISSLKAYENIIRGIDKTEYIFYIRILTSGIPKDLFSSDFQMNQETILGGFHSRFVVESRSIEMNSFLSSSVKRYDFVRIIIWRFRFIAKIGDKLTPAW